MAISATLVELFLSKSILVGSANQKLSKVTRVMRVGHVKGRGSTDIADKRT